MEKASPSAPSPRRVVARALFSASALGLGALLWAPRSVQGYALEGDQLGLDQRDVRVFNNFSDPEANDNHVPDPEFPGALGAPLAIWKAAVEWGSEHHGTGQGDPINVDGLGSGGADFDFSWQGLASSVGSVDDNIVSEIPGQSLGTLAFTELPIADGWRIRFYADAAVWHDGPGAPPPGNEQRDLQGVATHELGHALGLAHSMDTIATMLGAVIGSGVQLRSIENDDRNGLQAIYGVKSANKPHIAALFVPDASTLIVAGSGFAPNGNELWFTNGAPTADGTPLVLGGLAADPSGTRIACTPPVGALPGDVLVHVPGASGATLSNAFPYSPGEASCPPIVIYGTPKLNSQGTLPALYTNGRASLTTNDLRLGTGGGIPGATCVLISGQSSQNNPFQGGTLYVGGALRRYAPQSFDFIGSAEFAIPVTPSMVGTRRFFQLWFADAGDPFGVGLSDAVQIYFCP